MITDAAAAMPTARPVDPRSDSLVMTKRKIAALGGGMGSLSAVFWLTSQPGWQERFDVTVYQLGWRLGGKAASGRARDAFERNEEHGYHVLLGFYTGVLRVFPVIRMNKIHSSWGRHKPRW